jgi:hypothetical protein
LNFMAVTCLVLLSALCYRRSTVHPVSSLAYHHNVMNDRASVVLAEGFLQMGLEHTILDPNAVESLFPPSIIVHKGDGRKKRRPRANNTSLRPKRKLSKNI